MSLIRSDEVGGTAMVRLLSPVGWARQKLSSGVAFNIFLLSLRARGSLGWSLNTLACDQRSETVALSLEAVRQELRPFILLRIEGDDGSVGPRGRRSGDCAGDRRDEVILGGLQGALG